MKKIAILFLTFMSFQVFFSCKNSNSNSDPGIVAQNFFNALYSKNFPEAKKYATAGSAQMIDMIATFNKNVKDSSAMPDIKLVVDQVKIDGNTATARVTSMNNNNAVTAHLLKENDEWKVAFDKNSIMQMGSEVKNEKDTTAVDSMPTMPDSTKVKP